MVHIAADLSGVKGCVHNKLQLSLVIVYFTLSFINLIDKGVKEVLFRGFKWTILRSCHGQESFLIIITANQFVLPPEELF